MSPLLALVNNENVKRSITYMQTNWFQSLWLVAIFVYNHTFMISCDDLNTKLHYDEVMMNLWRFYDKLISFWKSSPSILITVRRCQAVLMWSCVRLAEQDVCGFGKTDVTTSDGSCSRWAGHERKRRLGAEHCTRAGSEGRRSQGLSSQFLQPFTFSMHARSSALIFCRKIQLETPCDTCVY